MGDRTLCMLCVRLGSQRLPTHTVGDGQQGRSLAQSCMLPRWGCNCFLVKNRVHLLLGILSVDATVDVSTVKDGETERERLLPGTCPLCKRQ